MDASDPLVVPSSRCCSQSGVVGPVHAVRALCIERKLHKGRKLLRILLTLFLYIASAPVRLACKYCRTEEINNCESRSHTDGDEQPSFLNASVQEQEITYLMACLSALPFEVLLHLRPTANWPSGEIVGEYAKESAPPDQLRLRLTRNSLGSLDET